MFFEFLDQGVKDSLKKLFKNNLSKRPKQTEHKNEKGIFAFFIKMIGGL